MARPLSLDLRERAVARVAAGESRRAVAKALGVSPSAVVKWSQRVARTGSAAPGRMGGHRRPKIAGADADWLRRRIRSDAFTLRGLVIELRERGLEISYFAVWRFVHAEGLSHKKNRGRGGAK